MKRLMAVVALLAMLAAAAALAQHNGHDYAKEKIQQAKVVSMKAEPTTIRTEAAVKEVDEVMVHMRELNQWMNQNGTCHAFRSMGEAMLQTGDRMQTMLRKMEEVCEDPATKPTPEQLREMDRLHDKLRGMTRELKDAHDMLERIVGA